MHVILITKLTLQTYNTHLKLKLYCHFIGSYSAIVCALIVSNVVNFINFVGYLAIMSILTGYFPMQLPVAML